MKRAPPPEKGAKVVAVDLFLGPGPPLDHREGVLEPLLTHRETKLLEPAPKGVPPAVLAQDEPRRAEADILRPHHFVRRPIGKNAVLVNPRLVREGVRADDGFVVRHGEPG